MNDTKIVVEQFISDVINDLYPTLNDNMSYLYGLEDKQSYVSGAAQLLDTKKDIYDMLEDDSTKAYTAMYDILAFFIWGWGAPLPDDNNLDVPPSQHPDKIRIFLAMFSYSDGNIVSVLKHCDDKTQKLQFQYGEQQGGLYDVLKSLYV